MNWPKTKHPALYKGAFYIDKAMIATRGTTWECRNCMAVTDWHNWQFSSVIATIYCVCPTCGKRHTGVIVNDKIKENDVANR